MKKFKVTFTDELWYLSEGVVEAKDKTAARKKFLQFAKKENFGKMTSYKDLEIKTIKTKVKKIEEM